MTDPGQNRNDTSTPKTAQTTVTTYANSMIFWGVIGLMTEFQLFLQVDPLDFGI